MTLKSRLLIHSVCALALAGCTTPPEGKPLPNLIFDHLDYRPVHVSAIDVINSYGAHRNPLDAAAAFAVPPDETLTKYLRARYRAQGGPGNLELDIREASILAYEVPSDVAVARWFDLGKFKEYTLTVRLHMVAHNIPGFYEQTKDFTAHRRVKISEHSSIAAREQDEFMAVDQMLQDIDASVYQALRSEFMIAD